MKSDRVMRLSPNDEAKAVTNNKKAGEIGRKTHTHFHHCIMPPKKPKTPDEVLVIALDISEF
jgi:hypothetical protein